MTGNETTQMTTRVLPLFARFLGHYDRLSVRSLLGLINYNSVIVNDDGRLIRIQLDRARLDDLLQLGHGSLDADKLNGTSSIENVMSMLMSTFRRPCFCVRLVYLLIDKKQRPGAAQGE